MFSQIVFVFNPLSGESRKILTALDQLKTIISKKYPKVCCQDCSLFSEELDGLIESLKSENCLFVACGGDGTVATVAEKIYLVPSFCLSVIPFGTGNDFSRAIGIFKNAKNLEKLAQIFLDPQALIKNFDIWTINERLFLNYFTMGYDAEIVNLFQKMRCKIPMILRCSFVNRILYLLSGIFHLFYSVSLGAMLQYEDEEIHLFGCKSIILANIDSYAGGKPLSPKVLYDDQKLNAFKINRIREELQLITGKGTSEATAMSNSFVLNLEHEITCQVDGEAFRLKQGKHLIKSIGTLRYWVRNMLK